MIQMMSNGMPIQMFAMVTATSDQRGDVSQLIGDAPSMRSTALTTPESLFSIHDQVDADTISGSSQGTRNSARRVIDSRKCWRKNSASTIPIANWNAIDARVNTAVWSSAGANVGSRSPAREVARSEEAHPEHPPPPSPPPPPPAPPPPHPRARERGRGGRPR